MRKDHQPPEKQPKFFFCNRVIPEDYVLHTASHAQRQEFIRVWEKADHSLS